VFDAVAEKGSFTETETAVMMKQILEALNYCHKLGIVHRDLKPENLLIMTLASGESVIKVADFGLAFKMQDGKMPEKAGTLDYLAPELLTTDEFTEAVDMWALGVITYIL
jgi:serine/threonine protein kinase